MDDAHATLVNSRKPVTWLPVFDFTDKRFAAFIDSSTSLKTAKHGRSEESSLIAPVQNRAALQEFLTSLAQAE